MTVQWPSNYSDDAMLLIYLAHFCGAPLILNYKKQEFKYGVTHRALARVAAPVLALQLAMQRESFHVH